VRDRKSRMGNFATTEPKLERFASCSSTCVVHDWAPEGKIHGLTHSLFHSLLSLIHSHSYRTLVIMPYSSEQPPSSGSQSLPSARLLLKAVRASQIRCTRFMCLVLLLVRQLVLKEMLALEAAPRYVVLQFQASLVGCIPSAVPWKPQFGTKLFFLPLLGYWVSLQLHMFMFRCSFLCFVTFFGFLGAF